MVVSVDVLLSLYRERFDVAVIGAGVLGVTVSYWLSVLFNCSVALIEQESDVAVHTSSRNTGVIHRPFYLDPLKKKIFAGASQKSFFLWKSLASRYGLSWNEVGTLEVANIDSDISVLEKFRGWSTLNGILDEEIDILDSKEVSRVEPMVSCMGALFSKTDVSVSFKEFTETVQKLVVKNGVKFLNNMCVEDVVEDGKGVKVKLKSSGKTSFLECDFLINAAGGEAIDIAHMMGVAKEYTDLHFRGEYWLVDEPFASKISHNVYSIPKQKDFPFLDPHFIVKYDGARQLGPNAVLVFGPKVYQGISNSVSEFLYKIFERPITPKINLGFNRKFLSLIWSEWYSSLSKGAMCDRVSKFIPALRSDMLSTRGLSGVRSSVIDAKGIVPEALQVYSDKSVHVLNYNSPGATGAPSYSAFIVANLIEKGYLDHLSKKSQDIRESIWSFEDACVIGCD